MELKKLDLSFYTDNTHLVQVLDFIGGNWAQGKVRGYGIVVIQTNNLTFGIPLRSNINHHAAYITVRGTVPGIRGKGLDFSKSVLITKPSHISTSQFKISPSEHSKLKSKAVFIKNSFEKYVERYIKAVKSNDQNILNSSEYRFSTLQNYHTQLGL